MFKTLSSESSFSFSASLVALSPFFPMLLCCLSFSILSQMSVINLCQPASLPWSLCTYLVHLHTWMSFMASLYLRRGQLTFLEPSVSPSWRSAFTGRSSSMHATWPIQSVPDESYLDFCRFRAIHYLIVCDVGIPTKVKNGSQVPLLDCSQEFDMMMVQGPGLASIQH